MATPDQVTDLQERVEKAREWLEDHNYKMTAAKCAEEHYAMKCRGHDSAELLSAYSAHENAALLTEVQKLRAGKAETLQLAKDCLDAAKAQGLELVKQPIAEYAALPIEEHFEFKNVRAEVAEAELARMRAAEPDMWWLYDDPELNCEPEDILREDFAEKQIVHFTSAYRGPDKWGFWRMKNDGTDDDECLFFNTKAEAVAALPAPPSGEKEK